MHPARQGLRQRTRKGAMLQACPYSRRNGAGDLRRHVAGKQLLDEHQAKIKGGPSATRRDQSSVNDDALVEQRFG
jgi:hypothetical protein